MIGSLIKEGLKYIWMMNNVNLNGWHEVFVIVGPVNLLRLIVQNNTESGMSANVSDSTKITEH